MQASTEIETQGVAACAVAAFSSRWVLDRSCRIGWMWRVEWSPRVDKWQWIVHAYSRCISPPPTRLVAFPATSVAVWPVRVRARVV